MAETASMMADAVDIFERIRQAQFFELLDDEKCVVCGGAAYIAWDEDADGNRFADHEFCTVEHDEACLVGRSVRFLERKAWLDSLGKLVAD